MIDEALQLIPIRHDAFTYIFLIGAVQSFFLSLVVSWHARWHNQILVLLSFFLFTMGALILDLYLARSGMMRGVLWYNDSTEWMVLCLGPSLFLISEGLLSKSKLSFRRVTLHFTIPAIYFCYQFFYILQPIEHKYNAYINSFHPDLPLLEYVSYFQSDPLSLKHRFERLLLISILSYAVAGFINMLRNDRFPKWTEILTSYNKYTFILWSFGSLIFNGVALIILFILTEEDTSHIFTGVMLSAEVFLLSILFLSGSNIFTSSWVADKYDTSGIKDISVHSIMEGITRIMEEEPSYLIQKYSLNDLAGAMGLPANHISQAINVAQGKNFSDYINGYRIRAAMKVIEEGGSDHLTIEGIGHEVGFSSKSAFYGAFKKVTGQTPLAFKNESGSA